MNDALMVGATIQDVLLSKITRFRFHPIALSTDIAKMYRQMGLQEPDRNFHRILWRNDPSEPMQHLRMKRVTYGVSSSSFHAIRCLFEVANRNTNPTVEHCLRHCFYVDDFLGGANSEDEAHQLVKDRCSELGNYYQFPLRKWSSNSVRVIQQLPSDLRERSNELEVLTVTR